MEPIITLALVLLAFYLVIRYGSKLAATLFGTRYRAYRQLAARYHGRCEARGLVDPPTVSFLHLGALVRVGLAPVIAGQYAPPRTRVVVRFGEGLPLRIELFPLARPSPPQPPRGTRAVRVGQQNFDRVYLLQANDAEIAREIFASDAARTAIEALRSLCLPAGVLVSVNPERMLVQVDRNLGSAFPQLDTAVKAALVLHECLVSNVRRRLGEGVKVVEVGATTSASDGPPMCEVCGDAIEGPHVVCAQCRTPCHRDCWNFVGSCSTFGCAGKQSVPAAGA